MNVSVIGLGKLGLPLAVLLARAGHKVFAFDSSESHLRALKSGEFISKEPQLMNFLNQAKNNLEFCSDISHATRTADAIFIIVPTPSQPNGFFSNTEVVKVINGFKPKDFLNRKIVINIYQDFYVKVQ